MTTNITLHPPGDGEGHRLIRTATVQRKCESGILNESGVCCEKFHSGEPGDICICSRCQGEGTIPQTVRVDVEVRLAQGYSAGLLIWKDQIGNPEKLLDIILQRYAAGEPVEGVTPAEVRDES